MFEMTHRMQASWAQSARLRNQERYGAYSPLYSFFTIGRHTSIADLRDRISSILQAEATYRIVGGGRGADGVMEVRLSSLDLGARIEAIDCETRAQAEDWCRQAALQKFRSDNDSTLWRIAIFSIASDGAVAVGIVCDHLITDGRSLWLFEQAVQAEDRRPDASGQRYLAWAEAQARDFGSSSATRGRQSRDFWREYLGGRQADAATELDFALPSTEKFNGAAVTISQVLGASLSSVRQTAVHHRVLPMSIVLAAVTTAAKRYTSSDRLAMRFITHGRPPAHSRTHGFFADSLPFQPNNALMSDERSAIARIHDFLKDAASHQDTPWDLIRTECGGHAVPVDIEPGDRQLVVNFIPYKGDAHSDAPTPSLIEHSGHIESLHVIVAPNDSAPGSISATFNPCHFTVAGVQTFMESIVDTFDGMTRRVTASE